MNLNRDIVNILSSSETALSSSELAALLGVGRSTIKRHLSALLVSGQLHRSGFGRATRYSTAADAYHMREDVTASQWMISSSQEKSELSNYLALPIASREITGYVRAFVDSYIPNHTFFLPETLAEALMKEGRMAWQQPAGTYARKVLEQLLIDLSWSSSKLEGNRYSLLATKELFRSGAAAGDMDAVMLLNHKQAIEFMVDAVPAYGLTPQVIRNLHAILMRDLLPDAESLGSIREKIVNITGTTYTPLQTPQILLEMFEAIAEKARQIKNPVEAAFFLWVNLAYLQPFEDGNKRTSRLAANIPLMIYNCAPLSFLDVEPTAYAYAMMGIYEKRNPELAITLFEQIYRRSIKRYAVTLDAMGLPDPFRLQHRENLNRAINLIVVEGDTAEAAVQAASLSDADKDRFMLLLREELKVLNEYNCARYRLTLRQVDKWIKAGRPA